MCKLSDIRSKYEQEKNLLLVFIVLFAYVSLPVLAEEPVKFGERTYAYCANQAGDYEDAINLAMIFASRYNSDFYDYIAIIYTKAEFTKLSKKLFGDAWEALIKQKYGYVFINPKGISNYEDLAVIRLEDGKFVVITVEQLGEEKN